MVCVDLIVPLSLILVFQGPSGVPISANDGFVGPRVSSQRLRWPEIGTRVGPRTAGRRYTRDAGRLNLDCVPIHTTVSLMTRRIIRWKRQRGALPSGRAVWIDVRKLDRAWKLGDRSFYLGWGGGEIDGIHERYDQFGQWIFETHDYVEMPFVGATALGGISFVGGRHRFAVTQIQP